MVGHGGSSASSYLADPTSPIPSHCAVMRLGRFRTLTPILQVIILCVHVTGWFYGELLLVNCCGRVN